MRNQLIFFFSALLFAVQFEFQFLCAQELEGDAKVIHSNSILNVEENSKWFTKEGSFHPHTKSVYFFENFDTPTEDNSLPEGWTQKRTTTTSEEPVVDAESPRWFRNSAEYGFTDPMNYVYSGTAAMAIGYTAPDFTWAITPEITIPETEGDVNLSYWAWIRSALPNGFDEPVITNYFIKVLMDGEWVSLYSYFGTDGEENIFEQQLVHTMNPFKGKTVRIAFIYEYFGWQMAIDDIFVGEILNDDFGVESLTAFPTFGLLSGDEIDLGIDVYCNGLNSGSVDVQLMVNDEVYQTQQTQNLEQGGANDFLVFNWTAPAPGNYNLKFVLPDDQFAANNELSVDIVVNQYQNLTEDFENYEFDDLGIPFLVFPPNDWTVNDLEWVTPTEEWPVFDGASANIHGRQGESEKSIITAPVELTAEDEWISFYLEGVNNSVDVGDTEGASTPGVQGYSTFQLKYSDSPDGPWTNLGDSIPFIPQYIIDENNDTTNVLPANRQRFIKQPISNLSGTVYFAFTTTSNFNLIIEETIYRSFVILDNVMVGRDALDYQDVNIALTDMSDNPIADAMVYISVNDEVKHEFKTDETGVHAISMIAGSYDYRVMKLGYEIAEGTMEIVETDEETKEVQSFTIELIVPDVLYNLTINAKDQEDNPLSDVLVALDDYYYEGNTDAQGSLLIEGFDNTPVGLTFSKDGYEGGTAMTEINNSDNTIDITLAQISTGVNELESSQVILFPNPADDFISVESKMNISSVYIFDLSGREIKSVYTADDNLKIQTSDLETGVYVFKIKTSDGTVIRKVSISR